MIVNVCTCYVKKLMYVYQIYYSEVSKIIITFMFEYTGEIMKIEIVRFCEHAFSKCYLSLRYIYR